MATRRQIIQALVVLPVVGLFPSLTKGLSRFQPFKRHISCVRTSPSRVKAELVIGHMPGVPMAGAFQEGFNLWSREHPGHRPVGQMTFEPCTVDHAPWLIHPLWESQPDHNDPVELARWMERTDKLYSPVGQVHLCQRWDVIDRAWQLRLGSYWQILQSEPWANQPDLVREDFLTWRARQLKRLAYVVVRFDAERVS